MLLTKLLKECNKMKLRTSEIQSVHQNKVMYVRYSKIPIIRRLRLFLTLTQPMQKEGRWAGTG